MDSKNNLIATVNHKPSKKNEGHYTAVNKSPTSRSWYKYDDDIVNLVNSEPVAAKLTATFTQNYWFPLSCLVKEQEETLETNTTTSVDMAMTATTVTSPVNMVTAHWAQKVINRRLQKTGILDTGATSGAAPEEDEDAFEDTGKLLKKTFMFPDKRTNKATKKMHLKHKPCPAAREMNIVPGLQLTLVSIPKLADAGYTPVFSKEGAVIYNTPLQSQPTSPPSWKPTGWTSQASGSSPSTQKKQWPMKSPHTMKP